MSTDLMPFDFEGQTIRTLGTPDEPLFVASDVAAILGYSATAAMTRRLDDDEKGVRDLHTLGGVQQVSVITESGLYSAIIGSQIPDAKRFKRWVTGTVLPQIRKTGSYVPELTPELMIANALVLAKQLIDQKDARIAELEPQAEVASRILDADGDMSVADTAKSLTRAGIKVGANRLFALLEGKYRWIYRAKGDGRYRVAQTAIESGHMSVIPQSHYHPKTGVLVLDPPQPRVTPKGLQRLLTDHGAE